MLKPVYINRDWRSGESEYRYEGGVGRIAEECGVKSRRNSMDGRQKGVNNCIEVFVSNSWKYLKANAMVFQLPGRNIVCPAIYCDFVAAGYKSR